MPPTEPTTPQRYTGRGQTMTVNADMVSAIVGRVADELARSNATEKVSLNDLNRVKAVAAEYLTECAETGQLPTVRGCAARCGVSRIAFYEFAKYHAGSDFAQWLEDFSDLCAEATMQAALAGAVKEVSAIFLAKARANWRDATQLEVVPVDNRRRFGAGLTTEQLAEKYATLIELDEVDETDD